MTVLRLCRPTNANHTQRQSSVIALHKEERAMPQTYYVAELLGVLPEPLPLAVAQAVAATLAIDANEIGTCQLLDSSGTSCWGVFRVHCVVCNQARAETAALWLARELGDPNRACILRAWQEPAGQAGGAK